LCVLVHRIMKGLGFDPIARRVKMYQILLVLVANMVPGLLLAPTRCVIASNKAATDLGMRAR